MDTENILILDDEIPITEILSEILSNDFYTIKSNTGIDALQIIRNFEISLAIVDINMPGMNGMDFIFQAKQIQPDIAYIIISGNSDINVAIDAFHIGTWDFIRKPFKDYDYIKKVIYNTLSKRQLLIENKKYKEKLEQMVQERTQELEIKNSELLQSHNKIISVLSKAAEYKDFETGQHLIRVSLYSEVISKGLGLSEQHTTLIKEAAPVHDIGKIGIPEKILLKRDKLTNDEYLEMQNHCIYGEEILKSHSINNMESKENNKIRQNDFSDNLLSVAAIIAKSHHERFDGSGYPRGLVGTDIPLEARIVAVADVYDALGTTRAYKDAWDEKSCRDYLFSQSGILFDPQVIDSFMKNIHNIMMIKESFIDDDSIKRSYLNAEKWL